MARANNGGWDFVKVGNSYQYKEDGWIAMVKIIEDNSTPEEYRFKLWVEKATDEPPQNGEFEITSIKNADGYYSGMLQIYEREEYGCNYRWVRGEEPVKSQKEADEIFSYLVKTTADTMKITNEQATKRVKALFDSGILEGGNADSIVSQIKITKFLATQID